MDLALVEAARSGDEEAFASIARGSADRLFVVAHRAVCRESSRTNVVFRALNDHRTTADGVQREVRLGVTRPDS